ncbi:helix-turn-helix transcriptional regulator [Pseudolactococcus plantarum]|uniref:Transcriptional regulator n=1 Tax=Pseudolactococcus plantarum TaxID=1365 RepID=A0A2A5RZQ6_9LACT|nr:YafY family protein [Lactococcus plantarum]PCS06737.1 transcriptional regulator [Lactococcus plantarum]HCN73923.1 YafY family transcriptional regulator [Lactococcus sp.]
MQTNRLFDIIYILLTTQKVTAKELSNQCQVSIRTIYRDIDRMSQAGIPIFTQKGSGGGVSLLSDFVLDKVLLNQSERQSILQALQTQDALNIDTATTESLTKLSALFGQISEPWLSIDLTRWYETDDYFEQLKTAILRRHMIRFLYYNAKGEYCDRQVEPLQLVFKSMSWYLKGYCLSKNDIRFFKLSRITKLVNTYHTYSDRRLPTEKLDKPILAEPDQVKLVMQVSAHLGYRIYDDFPISIIHQLPNGDLLVDGLVPKEDWLYSYILSLGENAIVIAPKSLKATILVKIEEMRKRYYE